MDRRVAFASLFALPVCVGACERAGSSAPSPLHWVPPRVGDRVDWTFDLDTEIVERDGVEHVITGHSELAGEVLAVAGDQVTRYRTTASVDRRVKDGVVQPPDLDTIDATITASGIVVSKNGAPVPAGEQDHDMQEARSELQGEAGRRSFYSHRFTVGERYRPTRGERLGLQLNADDVELVVRAIDEQAILFDVELTSDLPVARSIHAKGTLRLSNTGRDLDQAGELIDDGRKAGTMHVKIHAHLVEPVPARDR